MWAEVPNAAAVPSPERAREQGLSRRTRAVTGEENVSAREHPRLNGATRIVQRGDLRPRRAGTRRLLVPGARRLHQDGPASSSSIEDSAAPGEAPSSPPRRLAVGNGLLELAGRSTICGERQRRGVSGRGTRRRDDCREPRPPLPDRTATRSPCPYLAPTGAAHSPFTPIECWREHTRSSFEHQIRPGTSRTLSRSPSASIAGESRDASMSRWKVVRSGGAATISQSGGLTLQKWIELR